MPKITPIYIRNRLVRCFVNVNKRFIKEQARKQGKKISDKDIEKQLTADVKRAFELVKEDFSNPRRESFPKVIALLRQRCKMPKENEEDIMKRIHNLMGLVKNCEE